MEEKGIVEAWEKIRARVAEAGMVVFPGFPPDGGDLCWPGEDWSGFLDVAAAVGVRLVYAETATVSADRIAEIEELVPDPDHELVDALAAARAHVGRVAGIDLAFTHGGLVHSWSTELAWLAPIEDAPARGDRHLAGGRDDLDDEFGDPYEPGETGGPSRVTEDYWESRRRLEEARQAEAERLAPIVAEWVPRIAGHPDYLLARNQAARRSVAVAVFPELDDWHAGVPLGREDPEVLARRDARWELLRRAEDACEQLKADRLAAARADLDSLAADLRADPAYRSATTATLRRRIAGDFVTARLGFPSADLRDRLIATP